jgi:serine O-acetyltransferase
MGIMLHHRMGIVVGEMDRVGHNCSILHHITWIGSGKKGADQHPKIGIGSLIGVDASALENINVGNDVKINVGTLVIENLKDHSDK